MSEDFDPDKLHDPGGKTRIALPEDVRGDARYSHCGRYRQLLERDWTPQGETPRTLMFVGLNPSVAGATHQDPTCARETDRARRLGYTRYLKGNILDWRATSPRDIPHDPDIACSPGNLPALLEMANQSEAIVLAYGRVHKRYAAIVDRMLKALRETGRPLVCLGLNKDGSPKHPLYIRNDAPLVPFPLQGDSAGGDPGV
ncbi:DUF1643 domain-containing protein [Roseovarius salis]|uniref:DUF1643 domain-containing protein n=1 Tax=Roseovarius salis TaxID=3376063 RepID=UPI0037CC59E1